MTATFRSKSLVFILLFVAALSLRVVVARFLSSEIYDSRVYAQLATNLAQHGVYSHASEPPYEPSLIHVPGYPLLLAAAYKLFGVGDHTAVHILQALIDTATCGLVCLLAFYWEPDPRRKRAVSIAALVLAAICPFTLIYVSTILTETTATFLSVGMVLTATFAFRSTNERHTIWWWLLTGLLGGLAAMFQPNTSVFLIAIAITLVASILFASREHKQREDGRYEATLRLSRALFLSALISLAFGAALVPWTIRNWRVFRVFQPLAPVHASVPGEFVARGYRSWLRTWLDDERDVETMVDALDNSPIVIDDVPDHAFDSAAERQRVAALLNRYNRAGETTALIPESPTDTENAPPDASEEGEVDEVELGPEELDSADAPLETSVPVAMTPAIDLAFAQLARERVARSPVRYYVTLPIKRTVKLWFSTHSQYYPFEGELFAPEGSAHTTSQQVWLPLFTALIWIYTFLAVVGCWFLWQSKEFAARRWLLLGVLLIGLRLILFGFYEAPESRFVMELFPFVSILGGIATVRVIESFKPKPS